SSFLRGRPEVAVGIHGHRIADRVEHRKVGDGVRVRVRAFEVDVGELRDLADRVGLPRAVAVERELARIAAILTDVGARRDDTRDAEVLGARPIDLLRRAGYDVDGAPLGAR